MSKRNRKDKEQLIREIYIHLAEMSKDKVDTPEYSQAHHLAYQKICKLNPEVLRTLTRTVSTSGKSELVTTTKTTTFTVRRLNDAQVGFNCPKCGRLNRHGWPEGDDRSGHRISHCDCWPEGYYIEM